MCAYGYSVSSQWHSSHVVPFVDVSSKEKRMFFIASVFSYSCDFIYRHIENSSPSPSCLRTNHLSQSFQFRHTHVHSFVNFFRLFHSLFVFFIDRMSRHFTFYLWTCVCEWTWRLVMKSVNVDEYSQLHFSPKLNCVRYGERWTLYMYKHVHAQKRNTA